MLHRLCLGNSPRNRRLCANVKFDALVGNVPHALALGVLIGSLAIAGCGSPASSSDGGGDVIAGSTGDAGGGASGTVDGATAVGGASGAAGGGTGGATGGATGGSTTPAASEIPVPGIFQVSTSGNDSTGNGSAGRPWRTIGYALLHADDAHGTPEIVVAAGTYDESLAINRSVTITGAGASSVTVHNTDAANTDFLVRIGDGIAAGAADITVQIRGMRFDGESGKNRGVHAANTALTLDGVNVYAAGAFSVAIEPDSPAFTIRNSTFGFIGLLYSDIGIDVGANSTGSIANCTLGDHIDHAINIGSGCAVTIDNCSITGSTVHFADGIRIQGASNVTISNTTLIRPAGSEAAAAGPEHNRPYAGIEIAASSDLAATVSISNCTIRGFDVGIGMNMLWNAARVQNCTLGGNIAADVQTLWSGTSASQHPTVDFGGGTLGSTGGNDFGSGGETAVELQGPYNISSFGCIWGVSGAGIESRITDQLDDATRGRVQH